MGKICVVGIGPGDMENMTYRAAKAIEAADIVVGYGAYIELIRDYFPEKEFVSSGMTREVQRCRMALQKAQNGLKVALVSSGDSGIYGMAGVMLQVLNESGSAIPVEIIPGVTAASAGAALLGAPLMHDFAVISLSDLLTPWELICSRIRLALQGDFVLCLYNPRSKKRSGYIGIAREIAMEYRSPETPVGIVRNAGRKNEGCEITSLEGMLDFEIDMFSTVIIGNSATYVENGRIITPRGYVL